MLHAWAQFVVRRPIPIVVVLVGITLLLGLQAGSLRLDIRERDQLPQEHPYVELYNRVNDIFGGGAVAVVGVIVHDGDIFNPSTLGKIARMTRQIERLPEAARGTVTSIAAERVKVMKGTADGLEVRPAMEQVPTDDAGARQIRADLEREALYRGSLVSADGKAAAIVADVSVDFPYPVLHAKLEAIVAPERDDQTTIVLGGGPIMLSYLDRYTAQMAILFPIAVLVIALVHYEAFRTIQAMVLPLVTALMSVTWALGIMGIWHAPLDTWSSITPVAILAIAAGHAVQILKRYYEEFGKLNDNRAAVASSLEKVAPTMLAAGLIAAAGFASLATFQVTSIRVFGLLMSCGILSALVIELTFTPACRVLLPSPKRREVERERESRWLTVLLRLLARPVCERPWTVVAVAAGVMVVAIGGLLALEVDSSLRGYFTAASPVRIDDARINDNFAGASVMKVLIAGHEDGAMEQPEVLNAVDDLQRFLRGFPKVGKTVALTDFLKRMNQAMDGDRPESAAVPVSRALAAQYLLLYNPDDLSEVVDSASRNGVVIALCKSDEAAFAHRLFEQTREFAAQRFRGLPVTVGIAGGSLGAQAALNEVIVRDKIRNTIQVAVIIFVLSAIAFRSFVAGLMVLAPLVVGVAVTLGAMGWTHTWLSMSTATITAMGVSIGADFAIYLLFRLRDESRERDLIAAVRETLQTSGKAIFYVSTAITLGYLVLTVSGFSAWVHLGGITALMMAVSSLAAITLVPALVLITRPRFLR